MFILLNRSINAAYNTSNGGLKTDKYIIDFTKNVFITIVTNGIDQVEVNPEMLEKKLHRKACS